jgi:hypothetical protein
MGKTLMRTISRLSDLLSGMVFIFIITLIAYIIQL